MINELAVYKDIGCVTKNGIQYMQFNNLLKYDKILAHCFTTRIGGVSQGECSALNLGFNRNDSRENVLENYKRISECIDIKHENMVFSNQVHDNKIKAVTETDRGKGIIHKSDILGFDGLVTDRKEVALVTFYADCVPILFLDPVKKVIASSHSGWRGTVKEIARETILKMKSDFGCEPEDIEAAVGPSIGSCCFEVGEEVFEEFTTKLEYSKGYCIKTGEGKWHIDLQEVIKRTLLLSGVDKSKIFISGICTKCNKDVFYSHRGDKGRTGSLAAIMQLV